MIQGILTFQFVLNQKETGEIEPEFRPIQIVFREDEDYFTKENYSGLLAENDIFATFYQHTTGMIGVTKAHSNFYTGRLKETPYQIFSYFRQETEGSQFLALSIFELDDEIELFEELIKDLAKRLDAIFPPLIRAQNSRQISLISNINIRLANELKFTIFQIERLSRLDKLQKIALIFNTDERVKILELLRERPFAKEELKQKIEKIKPTINLDILLRPFLELNIIRRDWSKGEKDTKTGIIKNQGEYVFLVKDILLSRVPNESLLNHLKETKNNLYEIYRQKVVEFFNGYDPYTEPKEETKKLASILLNPDIYDFFALMRNNFYPLDKIPKVFSDFAVTEILLDNLKNLNIITQIKDEEDREWILLLTDIKPLVIFPEYLLPFIREKFKGYDEKDKISYEIAKKAFDLLEITYPDKIEF
ncbi:MAG: hypothetical protein ACFFHV_22770 [Promethearchaeota archaeon]